jgi:PAS domain S-box-containing protein
MKQEIQPSLAELRRRAEEKLKAQVRADQELSVEETRKLMYELRVRQMELELHNEELRRRHSRLEAAAGGPHYLEDQVMELSNNNQQLKREMDDHHQAGKELQAAKERLVAILESISDGFLVLDGNLVVTYFNDAAETLLGRKREEVLGRHLFEEAFPESRGSVFEKYYQQALREKKPVFFETYFEIAPYANWYEVRAYPYDDGLSIFFRVITEKKEAEQRIQRLASFPRLNPNPVLEVDEKGRVIYANPAARRVVEQLGLTEGLNAFLPGNLPDLFAQAREQGLRQYSLDLTLETRVYALELSFPHDLSTARIYAIDITARKQAEAEVLRAKEEWELTFHTVPDLIAILDTDHHILRANRAMAAALGKMPEDLIGRPCYEVVHRQDTPPEFCPHSLLLQDWQEHSSEIQELDRHYFVTVTPLKDNQGRVAGSVHVARDITDRKRAEERLQQALGEATLRHQETGALLRAARAVMDDHTFEDAAWKIFQQCKATTGAPAGYIALLSPDGAENEVLFLDAGGRPCSVDPDLPMPIRGLREEAYRTGKVVFDNSFLASGHVAFLPEGHVTLENILFAPLIHEAKVVGLIGLANKPGGFTDNDARLTSGFADLAAIALVSRRAEEKLRQTHAELEGRVVERTLALQLANEQLLREIEERQQVETRLRESEALFQAFMGNLPGTAVIRDLDGRYLFANETWENLVGLEKREWQGKTLADVWSPDMAQRFQNLDRQVVETGQALEHVVTLEGDEGPRYLLAHRFPILDAQGRPYLVGGIGIDITARRQAEEALVVERQRLFAVLENIPAYVALINRQGKIPFANREFIRRFGDPENRFCYEFFFGLEGPCQDCKALKVFATRTPEIWEWSGPDGNAYQIHDYPFTDVDGSPLVLEMGVDITDRKRAEAELAQHAEQIQDLYNNAPCGYHSLDSDGIMVQINDTELRWLGYSREEVLGKVKFPDLLTPASRQIFFDNFPGFKERGWVRDLEYEIVRKDGAIVPVVLSATAVTDAAGNYLMSRSTMFDISDRKRAEQALAEERQRFFHLLENLPAFVYLQAPDYSVRFANRVFRERFGEPETGSCYSIFWGRTDPCPDCPTFSVFHTGQPKEWELTRSDGRTYQIYDYPFADVDGSPLVLEMGIDITDRKRAEQIIRDQARELEAFFTHNITPLVFLDPDFNFLRVNEAYARSCRRPAAEFIGRNHFDLFPHTENEVIFRKVVESKRPHVALAKPFTFPDHPEWGVTYWDWSLSPILNEAGEVDFLVFSLNDVTERVQAEEDRNRLIEILEATPDLVAIADADRQVKYLNRAFRKALGLPEGSDPAQVEINLVHPRWATDLVLKEGFPMAAREGFWKGETAILAPDGWEMPVSQLILAHRDAAGRVQFFSSIARNISDLKEAQARIQRQSAILQGLNRILREALTCQTEDDLGQACLAVAQELTGSAFGFIDEVKEGGTFDFLAVSDPGWAGCGLSQVESPAPPPPVSVRRLYQDAIPGGMSLVINEPPALLHSPDGPAGQPSITAFLGVPMLFDGKVKGIIGLANKGSAYTQADQEAVEALAVAVVEGLLHHRTEKRLKESERRLRFLADQLLSAQENERKRLAAELHDELGHALLILRLSLSSVEKALLPKQKELKKELQENLTYINGIIEEIRRLYRDLSPGDLEDLGLTRALKSMIDDFAVYHSQVTWAVDLPDLDRLFSVPEQTIIYRIFQEALTNIGKHAQPSHVMIAARPEDGQVHFTIVDDGCGFNVAEVLGEGGSTRGLGLVAMDERLQMVGGTLAIHSIRGEGTQLSFTIPAAPEGERP